MYIIGKIKNVVNWPRDYANETDSEIAYLPTKHPLSSLEFRNLKKHKLVAEKIAALDGENELEVRIPHAHFDVGGFLYKVKKIQIPDLSKPEVVAFWCNIEKTREQKEMSKFTAKAFAPQNSEKECERLKKENENLTGWKTYQGRIIEKLTKQNVDLNFELLELKAELRRTKALMKKAYGFCTCKYQVVLNPNFHGVEEEIEEENEQEGGEGDEEGDREEVEEEIGEEVDDVNGEEVDEEHEPSVTEPTSKKRRVEEPEEVITIDSDEDDTTPTPARRPRRTHSKPCHRASKKRRAEESEPVEVITIDSDEDGTTPTPARRPRRNICRPSYCEISDDEDEWRPFVGKAWDWRRYEERGSKRNSARKSVAFAELSDGEGPSTRFGPRQAARSSRATSSRQPSPISSDGEGPSNRYQFQPSSTRRQSSSREMSPELSDGEGPSDLYERRRVAREAAREASRQAPRQVSPVSSDSEGSSASTLNQTPGNSTQKPQKRVRRRPVFDSDSD